MTKRFLMVSLIVTLAIVVLPLVMGIRAASAKAALATAEAPSITEGINPISSPMKKGLDTGEAVVDKSIVQQSPPNPSPLPEGVALGKAIAGMLIVRGEVTVNGRPVATGATVLRGSTVATGPGSHALINLGVEGLISIRANSSVTLKPTASSDIVDDKGSSGNYIVAPAPASIIGNALIRGIGQGAAHGDQSIPSMSASGGGFVGLFGKATTSSLHTITGGYLETGSEHDHDSDHDHDNDHGGHTSEKKPKPPDNDHDHDHDHH